MAALNVTQARRDFATVLSRVEHHGERIVLRRHGRDVVAIVPADDVRLLEAIEDRMDIEEAISRLRDGQKPVAYDAVRKQLGLD